MAARTETLFVPKKKKALTWEERSLKAAELVMSLIKAKREEEKSMLSDDEVCSGAEIFYWLLKMDEPQKERKLRKILKLLKPPVGPRRMDADLMSRFLTLMDIHQIGKSQHWKELMKFHDHEIELRTKEADPVFIKKVALLKSGQFDETSEKKFFNLLKSLLETELNRMCPEDGETPEQIAVKLKDFVEEACYPLKNHITRLCKQIDKSENIKTRSLFSQPFYSTAKELLLFLTEDHKFSHSELDFEERMRHFFTNIHFSGQVYGLLVLLRTDMKVEEKAPQMLQARQMPQAPQIPQVQQMAQAAQMPQVPQAPQMPQTPQTSIHMSPDLDALSRIATALGIIVDQGSTDRRYKQ